MEKQNKRFTIRLTDAEFYKLKSVMAKEKVSMTKLFREALAHITKNKEGVNPNN